jgi:hypothetical protein
MEQTDKHSRYYEKNKERIKSEHKVRWDNRSDEKKLHDKEWSRNYYLKYKRHLHAKNKDGLFKRPCPICSKTPLK